MEGEEGGRKGRKEGRKDGRKEGRKGKERKERKEGVEGRTCMSCMFVCLFLHSAHSAGLGQFGIRQSKRWVQFLCFKKLIISGNCLVDDSLEVDLFLRKVESALQLSRR